MTNQEKLEAIYLIYSPSSPIDNPNFFVGRQEQIYKVKEAIEERGQHAILYGGRGVGKTSLVNIVGSLFANVYTAKVTCNHADKFDTIWEKAISKIRLADTVTTIGFQPKSHAKELKLSFKDVEDLSPSHIEALFAEIDENVLVIFDEFDCITDFMTKLKMADTIKSLSDNVPNVTILIVGVSESIGQLIGVHPSVERCLKQIQLPLMSEQDAEEFISGSFGTLQLDVLPNVKQRIIEYTSGFPHYLHLLCKHAAIITVQNEENVVTEAYLDWAVEQSIENSNFSIKDAYKKATATVNNKSNFPEILLACALLQMDYNSSFSTTEIVQKFNQITNRKATAENLYYNLGMLCKTERAQVLQRVGNEKDTRYRFTNAVMKAFIKLTMHKALNLT